MGDGGWMMGDDRLSLQTRRKLKTETSRLDMERERESDNKMTAASGISIAHGYHIQIITSHAFDWNLNNIP